MMPDTRALLTRYIIEMKLDAMLRYLDEQIAESLTKYSDKQKVVL